MAEVCQSFAHNAWKKDLCTNCLKSIHEHEGVNLTETVVDKIEANNNSMVFNVRSMTTVYNSRNIDNRIESAKTTLHNSSSSENEGINASNINLHTVHIPSNVSNKDSINGLIGKPITNDNNVMIIQNSNPLKPSTTTKIIIGSNRSGCSNMTVIQSENSNPSSPNCENDDVSELGINIRRDSKTLSDINMKPTSSILKSNGPMNYDKKKRKISIELEKIEIIGYGGESSGPPPEENQDPPDPEELPNTEEEKEIAKITSTNTAWNCNKTNLLSDQIKKQKNKNEKVNSEELLADKMSASYPFHNKSLIFLNKLAIKQSSSKIDQLYSTVPPRRKSPPPRVSVKPFFREVPLTQTEQRLKIIAVAPMRRKSEDFSGARKTFNLITNEHLTKNSSPPLKNKNTVNRSLSSEIKAHINEEKVIGEDLKSEIINPDSEKIRSPPIVDINLNSKDNFKKSSPTNSETSSNLSYAVSHVVSHEPKSPSTCTFQATLAQNTPFRTFGKGDDIQPKTSPPPPLTPPSTTGNGDLVPIVVNTLDRKKLHIRNSLVNVVQTREGTKNGNFVSKEGSRATINKSHDVQVYDPVHNGRPIAKEVKLPEVPVYAEPSHDGSESYKSVDNQRENSDRLSLDSKSDAEIKGVCSHPDPRHKDKRPAPAPPVTSDSEVSSNPGESKALTLPVSPSSVQSGSSEDTRGKAATYSGHSKKMTPTDKTPSGNDTISKKKNRFSLKRLLKFGSKEQENSDRVSNLSNSPDDAPKFSFFSKYHKREDNSGLRKEDISPPILLEQCPAHERVAEWCARIPPSAEIENSPKVKGLAPEPPESQATPPATLITEIIKFDGQQKLKKVKPLPPPRTKTLSESSLKSIETTSPTLNSKENKPPEEMKTKNISAQSPKVIMTDYANLATAQPNQFNLEGDIRSSIVPKKPDRGTTNTSEDEEVEVQKRKAPPPPIRADKVHSFKETSHEFQYSPDKVGNILNNNVPTRPASFPSSTSKTATKPLHVTCIQINDSSHHKKFPHVENDQVEKVNQPYSKYKVIELPQIESVHTSQKAKAPPIPTKQPPVRPTVIEISLPNDGTKKLKSPTKETNHFNVFNVTYQKSESSDKHSDSKSFKDNEAPSNPPYQLDNNTNQSGNSPLSKSVEAKFRVISLPPSADVVEKELLDPSAKIMITTIQTASPSFTDVKVINEENGKIKEKFDMKESKETKIKRSAKIFSKNNEINFEKKTKILDGIEDAVDTLTQTTLRVVALNKNDSDEETNHVKEVVNCKHDSISDDSKSNFVVGTTSKNVALKEELSLLQTTLSQLRKTEPKVTSHDTDTFSKRQQTPDVSPKLSPDIVLTNSPELVGLQDSGISSKKQKLSDTFPKINSDVVITNSTVLSGPKDSDTLLKKQHNSNNTQNISSHMVLTNSTVVDDPGNSKKGKMPSKEPELSKTEEFSKIIIKFDDDHNSKHKTNDIGKEMIAKEIREFKETNVKKEIKELNSKLIEMKMKPSKIMTDESVQSSLNEVQNAKPLKEYKMEEDKQTNLKFQKQIKVEGKSPPILTEKPILKSHSHLDPVVIKKQESRHKTESPQKQMVNGSKNNLVGLSGTPHKISPQECISPNNAALLPSAQTKEASSYKNMELPHLKMKDLNAKVTVSSLQKMFEPSCARKITPSHPIEKADQRSETELPDVVIIETSGTRPESLYKTKVSELQKMFETNQFSSDVKSFSIKPSEEMSGKSIITSSSPATKTSSTETHPLIHTAHINTSLTPTDNSNTSPTHTTNINTPLISQTILTQHKLIESAATKASSNETHPLIHPTNINTSPTHTTNINTSLISQTILTQHKLIESAATKASSNETHPLIHPTNINTSPTHPTNINTPLISQYIPTQHKIIESVTTKTIIASEPIVTVRSYSDAIEHANVKAQSACDNIQISQIIAPASLHEQASIDNKMSKHEPSHSDVKSSTLSANLAAPIPFSTVAKSFDTVIYKKPYFSFIKESASALPLTSPPAIANEPSNFKVSDGVAQPIESTVDSIISSTNTRRKSRSFDEVTNQHPPRPLLKRSRESFRLVFNKSLEENYSSITNANLESLAQMMDHLAKDFTGESVIRINDNLKWNHFVLISNTPQIVTPYGIFYEAKWRYDEQLLFTLMVCKGRGLIGARPPYLHSLRCLAQFNDQIPTILLNPQTSNISQPSSVTLATVEVLNHCSLQSLQNFVHLNASIRLNKSPMYEREICFLLLQVVSGLKFLQAQGVEELTNTLDHFILIKNDNETFNRFVILNAEIYNMIPGEKPTNSRLCRLSLCHSVLKLMKLFVDGEESTENFTLVSKSPFSLKLGHVAAILKLEKADSLTWAMSAFEYMIWGPSEAPWSDASESDNLEEVAQMWLDLERARVVNSILRHSISGEVELSDIQEYQIPFLVRSTPQKLLDVHHIISEKIV